MGNRKKNNYQLSIVNSQLPKGWKIKKLGEVCDVFNGSTPLRRKKEFWENGNINWFTINDIRKQGRVISKTEQKITIKGFKSSSLKLLPKETVLLCCTASVGEYAITEIELTTNQQFNGLVVKDKNELLPYFLFYFSSTLKEKLLDVSGKTTIDFVSMTKVKNFEIPIPPLPEQKHIVSILDRAFSAIEQSRNNAEQNLKNAKELFQSKLQAIFDNGKLKIENGEWVEKKLKDVCEKITDGTHQTPKYFDNGFVFLSSKNVTSGKIDWNNVRYIDEKQHIEMHKRVSPKIGDILLAKNGTTGVAAMVDRDVIFDIYVSLAHIRVKDEVIPEFMLYFINSPIAKKQFNKRLKGIGVPNLHLQEIREVVINFPKSKSEQKQIVQELDVLQAETKKLEEIYQKKIEDLDELKKSILQKAFSGQLKIENGEWRIEKDN